MTDDIVAELDEFLSYPYAEDHLAMARHARDEIVALRKALTTTQLIIAQNTRAEALEEAAKVCETHDPSRETRNCAAAIRALK